MTDPQDQQAIDAANRLEGAVTGLRDELGELRAFGRRSRYMIWGLIASFVLHTGLAVAVLMVALNAAEASSLASRNEQTQLATCLSSNEVRAANARLWNYVLDLTSQNTQQRTPAQEEQVAQFRAYLAEVFAPRDCASTTTTPLPTPPTTTVATPTPTG